MNHLETKEERFRSELDWTSVCQVSRLGEEKICQELLIV